jgi:hypothetical protein
VKKTAAVVLIASLLLPSLSFAQETPTPITDAARKAVCDGAQLRAIEDSKHVGGVGGGVAWGLCLGLIGLGLAAVTVSTPDPPAYALVNQDKNYVLCYTDRYRDAAKSQKRHNRVVGALIGTAAFVAVLIVANSANSGNSY